MKTATGDVDIWPTVDCPHGFGGLIDWLKANPDRFDFLHLRFGEKTAALR